VEENSTRNSVPWNKNRSKLTDFRTLPGNRIQFRIPFGGTKVEANSAVPNHSVILNCCFYDVQDKDLNPGY
jgi:hypothetical protein